MTKLDVAVINRSVERAFAAMCAKLGVDLDNGNSSERVLISHWQEGDEPSYRLQVIRVADGAALSRCVTAHGEITL